MLEDNGTITTDVTGARIKRQTPPDCGQCEKYKAKFRRGWRKGNEWKFLRYLACSRFGHMPRPGGMDDQDGGEMFELVQLAMLEESVTRSRESERAYQTQALALRAAFGGK